MIVYYIHDITNRKPMVQVIKKSDSKNSAKKKLRIKKDSAKKGFDANKYCGIISWDIDPIEYQRKARTDRNESSS